ncbi:MAG: putative Ig domain-containing protein [Synergistaceae bacterium]|nr:putative Ig domain-containing protein [Synergistaceae bacterium]
MQGTLPPGLTLNSNGVISGIPEEAGALVRAEAGERTGMKYFTINVAPYDEKRGASSGGGGCNSGYGAAVIALIVPLLRRRKHQRRGTLPRKGGVFFCAHIMNWAIIRRIYP